MAQKTPAIPFAGLYEAQTVATAEIVQAALNGMQRLQQLTLQAMRAGAGGQFSLAQTMGSMRETGDINRAAAELAPAAEQGARYQRELLQAISEMNSEVVRASYSMMERMREAITASAGSLSMPTAMAGLAPRGEALSNPMAMYDSAMRQWQTAVQQMMETPAVAMAVASAQDDRERPARTAPARKTKRAAKRKQGAHPR
ncbi:MAG: phasin family protein [Burkholderiaceae bacterium]|nr:phasin family protein [Burkholderiaceae bacterium]